MGLSRDRATREGRCLSPFGQVKGPRNDNTNPIHLKVLVVRTAVALGSLSVFLTAFGGATAQSALEVQSWCEPIVTAQIPSAGRILFPTNFNTGFCWGAFGAMQDISRIVIDRGRLLLVCAPADSSRLQFIRVFYKYVSDHPEPANQPFGVIAQWSLAEAFPCVR